MLETRNANYAISLQMTNKLFLWKFKLFLPVIFVQKYLSFIEEKMVNLRKCRFSVRICPVSVI